MPRTLDLSAVLSVVLISGCTQQNVLPTVTLDLPEADLSSTDVDFGDVAWGENASRQVILTNLGDLPMGIDQISLVEDGMEDSFVLVWNPSSITCPEESNAEAARTDASVDTWDDPNPGPGDGDGSNPDNPADQVVVLDPDCSLTLNVGFSPASVGTVHGSIEVLTISEQEYEDEPSYHRDPDGFRKVVTLEGNGIKGIGNIVVRSPTVDMGHHYTGESHVEYLYVHNVGDGDLALGEPTLEKDCHDSFSVNVTSYDSDRVLPAGDASFLEIIFEPTDLDPAYCTLIVPSDDEDTPEVEVNIQGNAGSDPENEPPTITIHYPEAGYVHSSSEPLVMELDMFDINQPATTLYCKVKSLLAEAKIADCVPSDESGHIFVEIDTELLKEGTDTLLVTVTDQSELYSYASTTVIWAATHPEDDDDGDGWGDGLTEEDHYDCDDNDPTVYPSAAEIYDGKDNDCDGAVDENTLGNDDDGDTVSEAEGDCDDADADSYPGAPEQSDMKDNDCDGEVDEGTSLYDDDGDGFAEVDNDCNDSDPEVNPAATEVCDGIDNDCNGYKDHQEGCVEIDSEPMIIGGVRMAQTALGVGESTTMSVLVYDADGQTIGYTWQEDTDLTETGHSAISTPTAQTVTWTAPEELPGNADGAVYSVYVIVQDEDGNQDWAFDEIWVYDDPVATTIERIVVDEGDNVGCDGSTTSTSSSSTSDTAAAILFPSLSLLGMFAIRRRRRN